MAIPEHGIEALRKAAEYLVGLAGIEVYLKVKNPDGQPIDINGSLTFSGLSKAMRTSTIEVTDVATPLPGIPLADRNSMKVRNLSQVDRLYIGESTVTAGRNVGSVTDGDELDPDQETAVDIANGLPIYGITEPGKTILVKVTEYA